MATTTTPAATTSSLSTEKASYRGYVKLDEKGEIDKIMAKAESANQDSWKKMEATPGIQLLNENEFIRYTAKDLHAAQLLVPDAEQFMYVFQSGLNYIQNSKSNALMVELAENGDGTKGNPIIPAHNGETIDLKEYINEPPSKRSLSPLEKLERQIASLGLSPDMIQALLAQAAQKQAALAASTATAASTEEESTEVTA
jgi:hypothetical protein